MNNVSYPPVIELIEQRIGLSRQHQQHINVHRVLDDLVATLDDNGKLSLLASLRQRPITSPEWQRLIRALTIGETYFMRDRQHFRILRQHILPKITSQRPADKQLMIWSVGCATGEEPYSLAITLYEWLPNPAEWDLTIIGTDINQQALDTARRGTYREWSFRQTDNEFRARYFDAHADGTTYTLKPFIREMVNFQQMNILQQRPTSTADIILCRNVLLYFSNEQTRRTEQQLHQALAAGGWLFLGQAEALHSRRDQWVMHLFPGAPIYQKPAHPPQQATIQYPSEQKQHPATELDNDQPPLYTQAVDAIHHDNPTYAERQLAQLLATNPDHAKAHVLLAVAFANRRAYPEARAHLEAALTVEPLSADAHYVRAMIFIEQNDLSQARESLQAALYCQRDHALASFMLGNIYEQQGDVTAAQRHWHNAHHDIAGQDASTYLADISDMTVTTLRHHLADKIT